MIIITIIVAIVWSIDHPAIRSDLPIGPSERTDVAHLHHGSSKIPQKGSIIATVGPHKGILGATIEKLLVRLEKATLVDKVSVVVVVKTGWGERVKRGKVGVPSRGRTIGTSWGGKVWINVGFIVYASSEELALGLAYCVPSWEHG